MQILDIAIGLVFIFTLYSLFASLLLEIFATSIRFRARMLRYAIGRILQDPFSAKNVFEYLFSRIIALKRIFFPPKSDKFSQLFYRHPKIQTMYENSKHRLPSYIDAQTFSDVLVQLLRFPYLQDVGVDKIEKENKSKASAIEYTLFENTTFLQPEKKNVAQKNQQETNTEELTSGSDQIINYLRMVWVETNGDLMKFDAELQNWFNLVMMRMSGWYKRYVQVFLFVIGLGIAFVFNLDSIKIGQKLSQDTETRTQLVNMAIEFQKNPPEYATKIITSTPNGNRDTLSIKEYQQRHLELVNIGDSLLRNEITTTNTLLGISYYIPDVIAFPKDSVNSIINQKDTTAYLKNVKFYDYKNKTFSRVKSEKDKKVAIKYFATLGNVRPDSLLVGDYFYTHYKNRNYVELDICDKLEFASQTWSRKTIFGYLLSALAITLGAPFWFDLLSKLVNLRGTGRAISSSLENKKQDSGKSTSPQSPNYVAAKNRVG